MGKERMPVTARLFDRAYLERKLREMAAETAEALGGEEEVRRLVRGANEILEKVGLGGFASERADRVFGAMCVEHHIKYAVFVSPTRVVGFVKPRYEAVDGGKLAEPGALERLAKSNWAALGEDKLWLASMCNDWLTIRELAKDAFLLREVPYKLQRVIADLETLAKKRGGIFARELRVLRSFARDFFELALWFWEPEPKRFEFRGAQGTAVEGRWYAFEAEGRWDVIPVEKPEAAVGELVKRGGRSKMYHASDRLFRAYSKLVSHAGEAVFAYEDDHLIVFRTDALDTLAVIKPLPLYHGPAALSCLKPPIAWFTMWFDEFYLLPVDAALDLVTLDVNAELDKWERAEEGGDEEAAYIYYMYHGLAAVQEGLSEYEGARRRLAELALEGSWLRVARMARSVARMFRVDIAEVERAVERRLGLKLSKDVGFDGLGRIWDFFERLREERERSYSERERPFWRAVRMWAVLGRARGKPYEEAEKLLEMYYRRRCTKVARRVMMEGDKRGEEFYRECSPWEWVLEAAERVAEYELASLEDVLEDLRRRFGFPARRALEWKKLLDVMDESAKALAKVGDDKLPEALAKMDYSKWSEVEDKAFEAEEALDGYARLHPQLCEAALDYLYKRFLKESDARRARNLWWSLVGA